MSDLHYIIQEQCRKKGWSLSDASDKSGVSLFDLHQMINDHIPQAADLNKLATVFEINPAVLHVEAYGLKPDEYQLLEAWRSGDIVTLLKLVTELAETQARERRD